MNIQPVVSIIIPVYKVEKYLRCCLDSIVNQTYKNLEIILVDDGSPDGSPAICDAYAKKDPRITVIHQKNAGPAAARNAGLERMTGDYVSFIDSDDFVHREFIERLLRPCLENGVEVSIGDFCGVRENDGLDGFADRKLPPSKTICMTGREACYRLFGKTAQPTVWAHDKIIRADLLKDIRIPNWPKYDDVAFTYRYLYHAEKVTFTKHATLFYRENPAGITRQKFSDRFFDIIPILDEQMQFYLERREYILAGKTGESMWWHIMNCYDKMLQTGEKTTERKRILKKALRLLCKRSFAIKGLKLKRRVKYLIAALFPDTICRLCHQK